MADNNEVDADLKFSIIPEWLLDSDVSHKAIRVYAIIARYADSNTLTAWPARQTIATRANCTVKSVDRAVSELVEIGALSKEIRRDEKGGNHTSLYTLKRIRVGTKSTQGGRQNRPQGGDKIDPRTITNELEPVKEIYIQQFAQFWAAYPKKADKPLAERSFRKALERVKFKVIMDGVERYRDDPNREAAFTKNASTWLNADAWENEPLPARGRRGASKSRADANLARLRELERGN